MALQCVAHGSGLVGHATSSLWGHQAAELQYYLKIFDMRKYCRICCLMALQCFNYAAVNTGIGDDESHA